MFGQLKNEIKICRTCEQVPLLWTFKFDGCEYWCPSCGYTSGMFGAGITVPSTPKLIAEKNEWEIKSKPYLSDEVKDWIYAARIKFDVNQLIEFNSRAYKVLEIDEVMKSVVVESTINPIKKAIAEYNGNKIKLYGWTDYVEFKILQDGKN